MINVPCNNSLFLRFFSAILLDLIQRYKFPELRPQTQTECLKFVHLHFLNSLRLILVDYIAYLHNSTKPKQQILHSKCKHIPKTHSPFFVILPSFLHFGLLLKRFQQDATHIFSTCTLNHTHSSQHQMLA